MRPGARGTRGSNRARTIVYGSRVNRCPLRNLQKTRSLASGLEGGEKFGCVGKECLFPNVDLTLPTTENPSPTHHTFVFHFLRFSILPVFLPIVFVCMCACSGGRCHWLKAVISLVIIDPMPPVTSTTDWTENKGKIKMKGPCFLLSGRDRLSNGPFVLLTGMSLKPVKFQTFYIELESECRTFLLNCLGKRTVLLEHKTFLAD